MSPAFTADITRNALRQCNAPGCALPRDHINAWCRRHLDWARRLGHPSAKPYRASVWKKERQEVAAVFDAHPDHPGLLQVLGWLGDWMAKAAQSDQAFRGAREIARVSRHGVTPLQVLTEVAAFTVWEQANQHAFPDQRSRDFGMSRAVFGMAPRMRRACTPKGSKFGTWGQPTTGPRSYAVRPLPSGLAFVGKHLREVLAPLLANITQAVELQRQIKKDPQAALRLPFHATNPLA
ncbi:MAG: hypothetical protein IH627_09005 [Rubrivivax sp.]|nr:hypothetical protein [Rubrivivax sp.]